MRSAKNQKLTDSQIKTIKYLKDTGYSTIIIARVCNSMYGVALSTTYYHVRAMQPDDWNEKRGIQQQIQKMLNMGMTTQDISQEWGMPLAKVNKMFCL